MNLSFVIYMCFVDLEKAYDRVPEGVLWETLQAHGIPFNLYVNTVKTVGIFGIKSSIFLVGVEVPKAALFH